MKATSLLKSIAVIITAASLAYAPAAQAQRRGEGPRATHSSSSRGASHSSSSRGGSHSSRPSVSHNRPSASHSQSNPQKQIRPSVSNHKKPQPVQSSRPQYQSPGSNKHNGASRPGDGQQGHNNRPNGNNRPNHNQGKPNHNNGPGYNPGPNHGPGYNPGPNHGPGHNPGRPGHNPGRPTPPPPPGHHVNGHFWAGPPAAGWGWHRPTPPPRWRPAPRVPSVATFLGLAFGSAINLTINALANNGVTYTPYANGAVDLGGVTFFNCFWPQARMIYNNGYLTGQQFFYAANAYDPSRYNYMFNQLTAMYGAPVSNTSMAAGFTTTWFGANNGFITLTFEPMIGAYGNTYYYTTLSIGN